LTIKKCNKQAAADVTEAPTAAVPIGFVRDFTICSRLASRETLAAGTLAGVRTGAGQPSNVGSIPGKGWRGSVFCKTSRPTLGPHPAFCSVANRFSIPGGKAAEA